MNKNLYWYSSDVLSSEVANTHEFSKNPHIFYFSKKDNMNRLIDHHIIFLIKQHHKSRKRIWKTPCVCMKTQRRFFLVHLFLVKRQENGNVSRAIINGNDISLNIHSWNQEKSLNNTMSLSKTFFVNENTHRLVLKLDCHELLDLFQLVFIHFHVPPQSPFSQNHSRIFFPYMLRTFWIRPKVKTHFLFPFKAYLFIISHVFFLHFRKHQNSQFKTFWSHKHTQA